MSEAPNKQSPGRASTPKDFTEAVLSIVWPWITAIVSTRLRMAAIVVLASVVGLVKLFPDIEKGGLGKISVITDRFLHPPPALVVVVPKDIQAFPASIAGLKDQIGKKFHNRGAFQIVESETFPSATAILRFDVKQQADSVVVSVQLQTMNGGIVGSATAGVPNDLLSAAGPYLVDGLLDNLRVNWNTLEALNLPNRCNPVAKALLLAAEDIDDDHRPQAIELMRKAITLDNRCATAFWFLGELLIGAGEDAEAAIMKKRASQIDPEHPRINPRVAPLEALFRAIAAGTWRDLAPGLSMLKVSQPDFKEEFFAWQFDLKHYKMKLINQESEFGQTAAWFRSRGKAMFAINAGRFDRDAGQHLAASGLLILDGIRLSAPWQGNRGGVLAIWDNAVQIIPARDNDFTDFKAPFAVQATPVMIEPGGKWAMVTNDHDRQPRAAVCLLTDKSVVIAVVTGYGLSLWEFAKLLQPDNPGRKLNCDAAIALDGGPSVQVSFDGPEKLDLPGGWPVHDALGILMR